MCCQHARSIRVDQLVFYLCRFRGRCVCRPNSLKWMKRKNIHAVDRFMFGKMISCKQHPAPVSVASLPRSLSLSFTHFCAHFAFRVRARKVFVSTLNDVQFKRKKRAMLKCCRNASFNFYIMLRANWFKIVCDFNVQSMLTCSVLTPLSCSHIPYDSCAHTHTFFLHFGVAVFIFIFFTIFIFFFVHCDVGTARPSALGRRYIIDGGSGQREICGRNAWIEKCFHESIGW